MSARENGREDESKAKEKRTADKYVWEQTDAVDKGAKIKKKKNREASSTRLFYHLYVYVYIYTYACMYMCTCIHICKGEKKKNK